MKLPALLHNRLVQVMLVIAVIATALALTWRFTALSEIVTAEAVLDWVDTFKSKPWAPFALAAVYTPASVIMFPRPLLTLAAAMAFGPWMGIAVALGGIVLNALVGYSIGRMLDEKRIKRLGGPRFARVGKMLKKEGLLPVTLLGLLPVAPFFVEMLAFGALRLKLRHVIPGVILSNLPGTLGTTVLGDQIAAALSHERSLNPWIVAGVIAAMAAIAFYTHRKWRSLEAAAA